MSSKMFSRSLYNLRNLSRSSGFRPAVIAAGQPHFRSRSYVSTPQPAPAASASTSSLNQAELAKFAAIADSWWDAEGPFKPLHVMNPTRLTLIRSTLCRHFGKDPFSARPFEGLKFVDVGCGGGILSEPLARMGASVTGIDAVDKNIKIARLHADLDPVASSIEYHCTTAENLVEGQKEFDAVLALEVIEHVADPAEFCKSLSALTTSHGATVISTINRSMRAYATAIVAAEYILHWLPKGTHQWSSFLTPEELVMTLQRASISVEEMAGFAFDPLTGYAVGGGHVLHMVCDLTIAADNAIFGQTGPKVGSFDAGYGSSIMSRLVGPKKAREMWFLARFYTAQEAEKMGLINTVVPIEKLEQETVKWCREIIRNSPTAIRVLKSSINAVDDGHAGHQELGGNATLIFYGTEEGNEGKTAYMERRPPNFSKFPRRP